MIKLEKKFYDLASTVVREEGLSIYEMSYFRGLLRVYIYSKKTGTAVLEDCIGVDRAFNKYIDMLEWIPENFVLEVSSPGVNRKLKTQVHFEMACGGNVKLTLSKKDQSKKRCYEGKLIEVFDAGVELETIEGKLSLGFEEIKSAICI
jgi:ribosome maturation factor RimP